MSIVLMDWNRWSICGMEVCCAHKWTSEVKNNLLIDWRTYWHESSIIIVSSVGRFQMIFWQTVLCGGDKGENVQLESSLHDFLHIFRKTHKFLTTKKIIFAIKSKILTFISQHTQLTSEFSKIRDMFLHFYYYDNFFVTIIIIIE